MKDYLKSSDINFNLYATYIIITFIKKYENNPIVLESLKPQFTKDNLVLLSALLNKEHEKLIYNIIYILIVVSCFKEGETLFSLDENICCNIASFLGNNKIDNYLLCCGISLLKNICINKNVCGIFIKYKITEFFEEIYEKNLLNNKFMDCLMCSICNIISFEMKKPKGFYNIPILLPCIKIISTQLRHNYPATSLHRYIYRLYELCDTGNSEICNELLNCKIHRDLINLYPTLAEYGDELKNKLQKIISSQPELIITEEMKTMKNDMEYYESSCLLILKFLGKLLFVIDDVLVQSLLNKGLADFLCNLLSSHDIRVIKNVSFCLSNICAGSYGQIAYLFKNNCLYDLIKVSKNVYDAMEVRKEKDDYYYQLKDAFREIAHVFALAINNILMEHCVALVKSNNYTVLLVLMKGLELFGDNNNNEYLISVIFEVIYKLNLLSNSFDNDNINFIMQKYGLKENLEKIFQNKSLVYAQFAENLYNSLFGAF